jgi:hypothetical protein
MSNFDKQKSQKLLLERNIAERPEGWSDFSWRDLDGLDFADYIYEPSKVLISLLDSYFEWCEVPSREIDPGELMEEIAWVAFQSLKGGVELISYRSHSAQIDVEVSSSQELWFKLMTYLQLPERSRSILVEAKNLKKRISDAQFSRLCFLIENQFSQSCCLGVFFTTKGASGFDRLCLINARATQLLFHAKTQKFVIVLDKNDLRRLYKRGGLPRVLQEKIKEVESSYKKRIDLGNGIDIEQQPKLPPHLAKYQNH